MIAAALAATATCAAIVFVIMSIVVAVVDAQNDENANVMLAFVAIVFVFCGATFLCVMVWPWVYERVEGWL